jgi:xanthine dehydrogenase YagT iron-sulfur-binding subunit
MADGKPDPDEKNHVMTGMSRRSCLWQLGAGGMAATAYPLLPAAEALPADGRSGTGDVTTADTIPLRLRVNGQTLDLRVDVRTTLLDCLRESAQLTGTKKGCDHGQCGACTVHVNGRRVNACLSFAAMHENDEITTVEGLGQPEHLHPMQAAFVEHDGYQCGYCTSGQIMSAVALLTEPCGPSDADVKELMSGNICRCGAYPNIIAAIQQARQRASGAIQTDEIHQRG